MKFVGIIPARAGSKGIKDKNIRNVFNKPLIQWTLEMSLQCKNLNYLLCTSDSTEVEDLARKFMIKFVRRDKSLAEDRTKIEDVLIDLSKQLITDGFSHIVLLQATSPCTSSLIVDQCIQIAIDTNCDTVITGYINSHFHPSLLFKESSEGSVEWLMKSEVALRRQDFSPFLIRCGCCYVVKIDSLLAKRSLYGNKIKYLKVDPIHAVNIDQESDILIAEDALLKLYGAKGRLR